MKITKHNPDEEGMIHIRNCEGLLTMGIQKDLVTLWAATDPLTTNGIDMSFIVKTDGDTLTTDNYKHYVTSFIGSKDTYHLFGQEPIPSRKVVI